MHQPAGGAPTRTWHDGCLNARAAILASAGAPSPCWLLTLPDHSVAGPQDSQGPRPAGSGGPRPLIATAGPRRCRPTCARAHARAGGGPPGPGSASTRRRARPARRLQRRRHCAVPQAHGRDCGAAGARGAAPCRRAAQGGRKDVCAKPHELVSMASRWQWAARQG